ncbi:unnamed protein product [Darwinula stevensoni]|uniref:GP-PDE domain-containing protein n=1 Tax=Darwinula stevensoni TaxID=69355 RepID=A0A7R9ABP5_9CRUS|nr:unnamed protein product [Darwinula stevensoni]CAG0899436.1 unnamed protein product [Darwinula stevensoni]
MPALVAVDSTRLVADSTLWQRIRRGWPRLQQRSTCSFLDCLPVAHLRIPRPSEEAVRSVLGPAFDEDEAENMMDVIGHRGACLDAPENSLSAFRKCKEQGVKGVELDICLSKDGVAYAFHDDTFDRLTEATGPVSSLTWSQVQELHIRPPPGHENEFEKEKIPSLAEALNTCLDLGLKVIIDVKYSTHQVRKEDPRIVFSMGFRPWYYSHRAFSGQQGPSSPRFRHFKHILAVGLDLIMHWALMHILVDFLGISAILFVKDALHRYEVTRWKAKGVRVYAWTVNSPTAKRYFLEEVQVPILTDTLFPSVRKKPSLVSS